MKKVLAFVSAATASSLSFAAAPTTVAELATSVSFTDVVGAVFAIAGVVVTLYVAWKGAQFVIKAIRGA